MTDLRVLGSAVTMKDRIMVCSASHKSIEELVHDPQKEMTIAIVKGLFQAASEANETIKEIKLTTERIEP